MSTSDRPTDEITRDKVAARWIESMFEDPALARARLELLAHWRQLGIHGDDSIAAATRSAASEAPGVRIVTASLDGAHEQTLADVWRDAATVARGLTELGIDAGDRVGLQLPNGPHAYAGYLALNAVGACIVPIVQIYGPSDTRAILERAEAKALITAPRRDRPESVSWLADGDVAEVVIVDGGGPEHTLGWDALTARPCDDFEPVAAADWPAVLLYTSGTSGAPKGVVHTSNSILGHLKVMPCPSFEFQGTFLWSWPSGHIGGILAALSPFVRRIDTVLLGERWDTDFLLDTVRTYDVNGISGVTTVALRLLDAVESGSTPIRIREFFTGGAPIPPPMVDRAEQQGWHVTRCYGSTENPVVTATTPADSAEARRASEGRPVHGSRIRVVRDDGSNCDPGEDGELLIIAPQQMLGYDQPAHNGESFTPDGWLRTGDVGRLDATGCLTITDRKKDIIIRAGENISSKEIEDTLMKLPSVSEAAVVAMPDPQLGERACAFVILRPGHATLTLAEVREHFSAQGLARQKCPERLEVVTDLPRTANGKILKRELREALRRESAQDGSHR